MRRRSSGIAIAASLAIVFGLSLAAPRPAEAFIHEIIAALCRASGEDVEPPGQSLPDSKAFTRALTATGFIESMDTSDPTKVVIHFNPDVPNSKFMSAGFDLTIEDGVAPGVDLVLSPLVVFDPSFPAHAHCRNLR
jgi:hypothetical protein